MQTRSKQKYSSVLFYLLILTSFLMMLEISFFIECNRAYLSDYTFLTTNISIPRTIIPGILYFVFAQTLVHFVYCFLLWMIIELIFGLLHPLPNRKIYYVIAIWMTSFLTILTANQYYFPNSRFSELTSVIFFTPFIAKSAFCFLFSCCVILCILAISGLMHRLRHHLVSIMMTVAIIYFASLIYKPAEKQYFAANATRPNIILIGLDSLRPDFIGYFDISKKTPFLDSVLKQSAVFTEAITPSARTFPAWSSILTGQYPREMNIRSNLSAQNQSQFDTTLSSILKKNGYETIYATDETRFSNIDKNFGFDRVISPPMGLNDFLIGNFNDFPLSNLLINTRVGKLLFPHSYANRPVHFTYQPDSFLNLVNSALKKNRDKPLFLATHFCLTHAPYVWANYSGKGDSPQERYTASIVRMDKQIEDFFILLKQNHLLDNAIVVVLSDHGEALEFKGDRITEKDLYVDKTKQPPLFYPKGLDNEGFNQSAGHGTDVLGLPQYRVLLAFKFFGAGEFQTGKIPGVVSLLDIKPTLLDFLNLATPNSSGISLMNRIQDSTTQQIASRHLFIESEYSPPSIRTVYPEVRKVMLEGIDIFEINPLTTRLTVKNSMTTKIIASKQYADIYDGWMLALYPQSKDYRMPILVNLESGLWTNDLESDFAKHSPANKMLAELRAFYGEEIGFV